MREQNADCSGIIATSICFAMRRRDGNGSFWPCSLFLLLFAAKDQSSVDLARTYGTRRRTAWEANVAYDYGNFIVFLKTHHRQKDIRGSVAIADSVFYVRDSGGVLSRQDVPITSRTTHNAAGNAGRRGDRGRHSDGRSVPPICDGASGQGGS
jgi:hypothetical protein